MLAESFGDGIEHFRRTFAQHCEVLDASEGAVKLIGHFRAIRLEQGIYLALQDIFFRVPNPNSNPTPAPALPSRCMSLGIVLLTHPVTVMPVMINWLPILNSSAKYLARVFERAGRIIRRALKYKSKQEKRT